MLLWLRLLLFLFYFFASSSLLWFLFSVVLAIVLFFSRLLSFVYPSLCDLSFCTDINKRNGGGKGVAELCEMKNKINFFVKKFINFLFFCFFENEESWRNAKHTCTTISKCTTEREKGKVWMKLRDERVNESGEKLMYATKLQAKEMIEWELKSEERVKLQTVWTKSEYEMLNYLCMLVRNDNVTFRNFFQFSE